MNIFLSYARKDWRAHSESLGCSENGFIVSILRLLNQRGGDRVKILRDHDMSDGRIWTEELAKYINESDLFLIFFSEAWACSDVCWREYLHAQTYRSDMPVVGIWLYQVPESFVPVFEHDDGDARFDLYRLTFPQLYAHFMTQNAPDTKHCAAEKMPDFHPDVTPFLQRLDGVFAEPKNVQARMNTFARPYSQMISEVMKNTAPKLLDSAAANAAPDPASDLYVAGAPLRPAAPQDAPRRQKATIRRRAWDFVEVPSGTVKLPNGTDITIERPFWIMQEAVAVRDILVDPHGRPMTQVRLRELSEKVRRLSSRKANLRLPSVDQWDAAQFIWRGQAAKAGATLHSGNAEPVSWFRSAEAGKKELVVGYASVARPFSEMTPSERETVVAKRVLGGDFGLEKLNMDTSARDYWLRLVINLN